MKSQWRQGAVLSAAAIMLAACGGSDDADKAAKAESSVEAASDASVAELAPDASTADAMSVDVAAGGVEPMTDPGYIAAPPIAEVEPAGQAQ